MRTRWTALLLSLAYLLGCSKAAPRVVTLSNGKTVKVLQVVPMHFPSGETSLMVKYQTDLKISDQDALRREADEIWGSFQIDAENAHVQSAIISATEVPEGAVTEQSQGYNFVFRKSGDGTWKSLSNK